MTTRKTKLIGIIAVMLCLTAAFMLFGCSQPQSSSSTQSESLEVEDTTEPAATGIRNILVIGNDSWEGRAGHADLMCLVRVDLDNHRVYEVTVPRDTRHEFSDGSIDKLNYVITNEGVDAQVKAVSELLGTSIDYYAMIGLDQFEQLVDYFGGIDVDLPYSIDYTFYTKDFPMESYESGEQTLTGWRAMALSRARTGYSGSEQDMVRQYVDRQMLTTLMGMAYKNGTDGIEPLFTALQDMIETNIPLDEQIAWAEALGSTGSFEVIGTSGPFTGDIDATTDVWLVYPDEQGWANLMNAVESDGDLEAATSTYEYSVFPDDIPAVVDTTITVG